MSRFYGLPVPVLSDTQAAFTITVPVVGALLSIVVPRLLDRRKDRSATKNAEKTVAVQEQDLAGKLQDQIFDGSMEILEQYRKRANEESLRASDLDALLVVCRRERNAFEEQIGTLRREKETAVGELTVAMNRLTEENARLRAGQQVKGEGA